MNNYRLLLKISIIWLVLAALVEIILFALYAPMWLLYILGLPAIAVGPPLAVYGLYMLYKRVRRRQ